MLVLYDRLPCDLIPDGATLLVESDVILFLDDRPDTQNGEFHLHVFECYWERLVLHLAVDHTSALVDQLLSTSGGSIVASFRGCRGHDLISTLWEMPFNPCCVDRGPIVDEAQHLIGAALEFHWLGSQCLPDLLIRIRDCGQEWMLAQ